MERGLFSPLLPFSSPQPVTPSLSVPSSLPPFFAPKKEGKEGREDQKGQTKRGREGGTFVCSGGGKKKRGPEGEEFDDDL